MDGFKMFRIEACCEIDWRLDRTRQALLRPFQPQLDKVHTHVFVLEQPRLLPSGYSLSSIFPFLFRSAVERSFALCTDMGILSLISRRPFKPLGFHFCTRYCNNSNKLLNICARYSTITSVRPSLLRLDQSDRQLWCPFRVSQFCLS